MEGHDFNSRRTARIEQELTNTFFYSPAILFLIAGHNVFANLLRELKDGEL